MSTQMVNAFIYQVEPTVQGSLKQFAKVQVPSGSTEQQAWSTYVRQHGTPPLAEYVVFIGGHRYQVKPAQSTIINDLGAAT